jgi:hypothetical protein
LDAGLPDGIISNQNPNLGKFWRVLQWEMLRYFGIVGGHLVYFVVIWNIFFRFGMLYQE